MLHKLDLSRVNSAYVADELAIVWGEGDKRIITNCEFIHWVGQPNDTDDIRVNQRNQHPPQYHEFTTEELRLATGESVNIPKWGHYFGIKARMASNYATLLDSMREIGADVSDMPKWQDKH